MRDGGAREMGLGPLDLVGLAAARERAREARRLLLDGLDPIELRRSRRTKAKVEAARGLSFKEAAEKYIAAHEAGWRNAKHREQWRATLATYAYPTMGALPVAAIDTAIVLKALEQIWHEKPETASRLRGRIASVLDWAAARNLREGDNPARWRGHLDKLLPAKQKIRGVKHHAAMTYADVPAFVALLRGQTRISARALEFTILNASRTSEVIGARWLEIDLAAKVWTVAGERMKSGRVHRVPLSDRALEILEQMPREGDFVFPGGKAKRPLSNMAMAELLKGMHSNRFTVHGFRSSFRDWAAECTNYPREIAETALAHVTKDKTEAAYKRGDALEKRRRLMRDWAKFCSSNLSATNVVPIRGKSS